MGRSDDGDNVSMASILDKLENKLVLMLMAALLGVGGNQFIQHAKPEVVRPDPFTGTDAKDMEVRIKGWVNLRMKAHDAHLVSSSKGWDLIYEMHEDIAVIKTMLAIRSEEEK